MTQHPTSMPQNPTVCGGQRRSPRSSSDARAIEEIEEVEDDETEDDSDRDEEHAAEVALSTPAGPVFGGRGVGGIVLPLGLGRVAIRPD
jgi:hypothetical protein